MTDKAMPEGNVISEEMDIFIDKYIHSIMHLEILLLLFRNSHQEYGEKIIQEQLHLRIERVQKILSELYSDKLLSVRKFDSMTSYFYQQNSDKKQIVDSLNKAYIQNKSDVVKTIITKMQINEKRTIENIG